MWYNIVIHNFLFDIVLTCCSIFPPYFRLWHLHRMTSFLNLVISHQLRVARFASTPWQHNEYYCPLLFLSLSLYGIIIISMKCDSPEDVLKQ